MAITSSKPRHLRRAQRRAEAAARQESRSHLTAMQQVERLDWRLGKLRGARKERARLEQANSLL